MGREVAAEQPAASEASEAVQRGRMAERFARRPRTPATADFDLPAPNDAAEQQADQFCDSHCTWLDHHPDCAWAEQPVAEPELLPLPEPLEIDWPQLNSNALGCGVEDRNIHDRYEAAEYGWQDGVDKAADRVPNEIYDGEMMQAYARAHLSAGQGKDSELLDRLDAWRAIESKTGACWASMHFDLSKPVRGQIDAAIIKAADEIAAIEAREAATKGEQQ